MTTSLPEPLPEPLAVVSAVVQTGLVETPYRRAGHGRPVLLLLGPGGPGDADGLFDGLAARFRVVQPWAGPVPAGAADGAAAGAAEWGGWLRGVIDGLGLDRPALVVGDELAEAADRFAREDPDRAGPVVAVADRDPARVMAALLSAFEARAQDY